LILNDLAEVLYAPNKSFKRIINNPKYLGAIIILILFIGIQVGYQYMQFSKTYTEQTYPTIDQLHTFNNATIWQTNSNIAITNNFDDFYNHSIYVAGFGLSPNDPNAYYKAFGNNSLQIQANNTNSITAAIGNIFNIDCTHNGYQNLTLVLKQLEPETMPQNANLTLYSLSDDNYYQYDLTSQLANASTTAQWNNLTLPLGPNNENWSINGTPQWSNITSIKLDLSYPSNENITLRIGAFFFHGQYLTPIQYNSTGVLLQFLQLFTLQFLFTWFILTGIIYLIFRLLKGSLTWKPLFVALGFALIFMVIRAVINLAATATFPMIYYPFDLSLGVRFDPFVALYYPAEAISALPIQSQVIFHTIDAATSIFRTIVAAIAVISYAWVGALAAIALKNLKPEFSTVKCLVISAVSLVITVLLLVFLVGAI
jgi:hypothetical protein